MRNNVTAKQLEISADPNKFYHIPNYNGYMINCNDQIISFKNPISYPNGYELKRERNGGYRLRDEDGRTQRVQVREIWNYINDYIESGNKIDSLCMDLGDNKIYLGGRNKLAASLKPQIPIKDKVPVHALDMSGLVYGTNNEISCFMCFDQNDLDNL